jgi:hypothetical protein
LKDFIREAHPDGKILNGLDFPSSHEFIRTFPFASDKIVWHGARGLPFCREEFPTTKKRWGLCATAGAFHTAHVDTEGEGTFIKVDSGVKIWMIGVPKTQRTEGHNAFDAYADVGTFLGKYNLDGTNVHRWKWQAVVLRPGMEL